jgi:hypothetical protein
MIPVHEKTLMGWKYISSHSQFQYGVLVSRQLHSRDNLIGGKQPWLSIPQEVWCESGKFWVVRREDKFSRSFRESNGDSSVSST